MRGTNIKLYTVVCMTECYGYSIHIMLYSSEEFIVPMNYFCHTLLLLISYLSVFFVNTVLDIRALF
jgi:hypothetical protein